MAINNLAHDVLILGVELWHGLMPQMLANTVQPEHVVVPTPIPPARVVWSS